jgi:hypothetical protein
VDKPNRIEVGGIKVKEINKVVIFVAFLFIFMLFNIYNIEPAYWSNTPLSTAVTDQDQCIAQTIIFPNGYNSEGTNLSYYGHGGIVSAIYDVQGIPQRTVGKNILETISGMYNEKYPSGIYIIKEELYTYDLAVLKEKSWTRYTERLKLLSCINYQGNDKIGDLGQTYILRIS